MTQTAEQRRLDNDRLGLEPWRRWGPYVSERSWGTVREDYSHNGDAWGFLTHDQARSKAYRWGEDGLAGFCDRYQLLVFSLCLWNRVDPILKERLYGLVPSEANHGEDVKECYYYLDATPTHSYMKYLYKYPQTEFPYQQLIDQNRHRSREKGEYELLDTGIFDEHRYWDVYVEFAKIDAEDIVIRIEAFNRGPETASLDIIPQFCFRNTWAWGPERHSSPRMQLVPIEKDLTCILVDDSQGRGLTNLMSPYSLGPRYWYAQRGGKPLFTDNESNHRRLYGQDFVSPTGYAKDGFHEHIIHGKPAVRTDETGTKACVMYDNVTVESGQSCVLTMRLSDKQLDDPLEGVERWVKTRKSEADEFYASIHPPKATADECLVQRQALSGMIWTKQIYLFDVYKWLNGDNVSDPPPESRHRIRNSHWKHLNSMRILSMPDKWEYPWFAAWDLAFHCVPLALVDPEFAKEQLWLLLFEQFQHPNGQIPAYEWEFSDLNPPVHAWAVWRVYNMDRLQTGRADRLFLEKCFHKLLMNFAWWVNKVDGEGNNVFEGGFLGLDNITTFDRSIPPADGSSLKQADATGWMGMYCLNLMRIALELAKENQAYVGLATKFLEHYVYIGSAIKNMGGRNFNLWSQQDGLFYDVLCYPDGTYHRFRLRSLVSLIPLYATERLEEKWIEAFPLFKANFDWLLRNRQSLVQSCITTMDNQSGRVHLLSLVDASQLQRILTAMWDPNEFRSPFGLRSLSKYHQNNPYCFAGSDVEYEPAETKMYLKGGNSNWRGPLWFPTTFLMIESLRKLAKGYEDAIQIGSVDAENCSTTLLGMAQGYADRMISMFVREPGGRRAIFGNRELLQTDPNWRDNLLFHEYFNAETGEGLGACHQTGWTGLVASLIDEWRR